MTTTASCGSSRCQPDFRPLPPRKATGPLMRLLHSMPAILLVMRGSALCQAEQGHRFRQWRTQSVLPTPCFGPPFPQKLCCRPVATQYDGDPGVPRLSANGARPSAGSGALGGATNILYRVFATLLAPNTEASLAKRATGLGPQCAKQAWSTILTCAGRPIEAGAPSGKGHVCSLATG